MLNLMRIVVDYETADPLLLRQQLDMTVAFTEQLKVDPPMLLKSLQRVKNLYIT
jgi:hypothetical protein